MSKARTVDRDAKALQLRLDGETYDKIATSLKFGHRGHAYDAVKRRLAAAAKQCSEAAHEILAQELLRLDQMLAAITKKIHSGDLLAIDRALKIQDRRASYLGLDSPKHLKIELERELSGNIEKLKAGLPPDVFEQVLSVLAGEHGAATPESDPDGSAEGKVRGDG